MIRNYNQFNFLKRNDPKVSPFLFKKEQKDNNDQERLVDYKDTAKQLEQLEESINFISSSGNNFKQDERLVVVGIPRTKDNQRALGQLLGKSFLSL